MYQISIHNHNVYHFNVNGIFIKCLMLIIVNFLFVYLGKWCMYFESNKIKYPLHESFVQPLLYGFCVKGRRVTICYEWIVLQPVDIQGKVCHMHVGCSVIYCKGIIYIFFFSYFVCFDTYQYTGNSFNPLVLMFGHICVKGWWYTTRW